MPINKGHEDLKNELLQILEQVGAENIWRPVMGPGQVLLANGISDMREATVEDMSRVPFSGKSVLDIGCNFGYYSFLARKLGADRVTGVDLDPLAIRGADILRMLGGWDGIQFMCRDFTGPGMTESYDICLLINFFGRFKIRKGVEGQLAAVSRLSRETMVLSARPFYEIHKHLDGEDDRLLEHYPAGYVRNGRFYFGEYVRDFFAPDWRVSQVSRDDDQTLEATLMFSRK